MRSKNPHDLSEHDKKHDRRAQFRVSPQHVRELIFRSEIDIEKRPEITSDLVTIELECAINPRKLNGNRYEVVLGFHIKANMNTSAEVIYDLQLTYGGIIQLQEEITDATRLETVLYVNAPGLIYPFARQLIASITKDAGFRPLELDPINFYVLYMKRKEAGAQQRDAG